MRTTSNLIFSGTSGLVLPVPKSLYPPQFRDKSRLCYYASLFNSIEINSSFYKVPKASTVSKWANSVPADFQFTFKLPKTISHAKGLIFNSQDIDYFLQVISNAGDRKGCLLVQFPPSLKIDKFKEFEKLLAAIRASDAGQLWKLAVEFRNQSWYHSDTYHLLGNYNAGMVIQDLPASATPLIHKAGFVYIRFHGPGGSYRGSYPDDFLFRYAQLIRGWIKERKPVYFYFNNTMGDATKNLLTLIDFLQP